jgi:methyl-accepting chemotaxis protein
MAECEMVPGCSFFHDRMERLPFAAEQMKQKYCLGSNVDCARYRVRCALGREHVPSDLFPHDLKRADRLIEEALATKTP